MKKMYRYGFMQGPPSPNAMTQPFPLLPFHSLPFPPIPSPSLRSRTHQIQLGGLGECCELS